MKAAYNDIKDKIKTTPLWYDENGVPRYEKFHPNLSPNIYAEEVALLEIACQYCHKRFLVEVNFCKFDLVFNKSKKSLSNQVTLYMKNRNTFIPVHYGDPPRHDCDGGGDTMNCYDLRIKEFWQKKKFKWQRIKKYEIELEKEC